VVARTAPENARFNHHPGRSRGNLPYAPLYGFDFSVRKRKKSDTPDKYRPKDATGTQQSGGSEW
jgi:hypothetical protein